MDTNRYEINTHWDLERTKYKEKNKREEHLCSIEEREKERVTVKCYCLLNINLLAEYCSDKQYFSKHQKCDQTNCAKDKCRQTVCFLMKPNYSNCLKREKLKVRRKKEMKTRKCSKHSWQNTGWAQIFSLFSAHSSWSITVLRIAHTKCLQSIGFIGDHEREKRTKELRKSFLSFCSNSFLMLLLNYYICNIWFVWREIVYEEMNE